MSEASRAAALAHAAMIHQGTGDAATALETAEAFHAFIVGTPEASDEPAPLPTRRKAVAPVKAAAPVKKAKPSPVEDDADDEEEAAEDDEGGVTAEAVGEKVEELLNANLRDETVALFKKFKAKSLSGLKASDFAKFIAGADALLLSA